MTNPEHTMNLKRILLVDFVQYRGAGDVLINVTPQVRDPDTDEVLGVTPTENVHTTHDELAKLAGGPNWGDKEVETTILAATRTTQEEIPEEERDPDAPEDARTTRDIEVARFPDHSVVWE